MKRYLAVLIVGVALGVGLAVPLMALASSPFPPTDSPRASGQTYAVNSPGEMTTQCEQHMQDSGGRMGMMGMMMVGRTGRTIMEPTFDGAAGMHAGCQEMMDQDYEAMHQMMGEMMQSGSYEEMHRACHEWMGS